MVGLCKRGAQFSHSYGEFYINLNFVSGDGFVFWCALREGCGGRPEGAVSPRRARRDGALANPGASPTRAQRGARQKNQSGRIAVLFY